MNEFFGPGGILEQKLGDYEFRPSQIRMAEAVYQALENQSHVIIEAGTNLMMRGGVMVKMESAATMTLKASANYDMQASGTMTLMGSMININ